MSDNGENEVEVEVEVQNNANLPKDVISEAGSIKLFNKWSYEDVEIRDISLTYGFSLKYTISTPKNWQDLNTEENRGLTQDTNLQ